MARKTAIASLSSGDLKIVPAQEGESLRIKMSGVVDMRDPQTLLNPYWEKQLRTAPPACAVLFDGGVLGRRVPLGNERIELGGRPFLHKASFPAPRYGISGSIYCREAP